LKKPKRRRFCKAKSKKKKKIENRSDQKLGRVTDFYRF